MIGVVSIGCLFPFLILMGSSLSASGGEDADLIGVPGKLVSDPRFWLALLCSTVMALLPDVLTAGMQRLCAPADYQILQVRSLLCVSTRLTCEHLCSSNLAAHCRHATRLIFRHALPQSYRGHRLEIGVHRLKQEADAKVRSIETEQLLAGAAGSSTEALQVVNEELHVPPATAVGQRTQGLPFESE